MELQEPFYETHLGKAYLGDSLEIMQSLPENSVNLVVTSPPFALVFKKAYGNKDQHEYVEWFLQYAREVHRVLQQDGSFVLDIGGAWNRSIPTRSLYQYKLLIALVEQVGFHLAQDCYWHNPGAIPAPAEWVNVRRIRVKGAVNHLWWLSKTSWPKADNRKVLKPYSADMTRLIKRGVKPTKRPSGHIITDKWKDQGGAIPSNLLEMGNNDANSTYLKKCRAAGLPVHPARFPRGLPEFFMKLTTSEGDVVLDPFAGSNMTGEVAEDLGRRWIAIELEENYLRGSQFRFIQPTLPMDCIS
ncbi:MAG TPA: site-specific DNA-methyltransferase [Ktedonobacteraceae bacterium]|jgi:site-specific DNA-methyltransferase (cytosine-N4-specific)